MSGNLLDLAERLEQKATAIEEAASKAASFVADGILTDLVLHTPVDTSKALSSWIVTFDKPSDYVGKAHYEGTKGSTQEASAAKAISIGRAELKKKKVGQSIFITNNQPYIVRLNNGWSNQQPAGFVERSSLLGRKLLELYNLKVK